ncbi:AAA family ATPase [Actinomyces oris]|jgi:SMC domain protein|uniref:AAA family ATPase n=1 Tax=Actinomyces oris TaxID=544580 RepID=A0A508BNC7_9ACTO|nr:ATP-binding protein [Actinomyces oris]QQC39525.1 AAA family ATPase [Actinomyces oris]TQD63349.1 AAA family ATPase [Actinomyces oris]
MDSPRLVKLRLGSFKSFKNQELPISSLTMLIGRNASGKSNTLDALSLLALLSSDRTLTDLDRDDPEVAGLRGGLSGCTPFNQGSIDVGVTIDLGDDTQAVLDIELDPQRFEVLRERLRLTGQRNLTLIEAVQDDPGSGLISAKIYSGGSPKIFSMPANRMVAFQAVTRVPEDTKSRRLVVGVARRVIEVLSGIFVLDPVPSSMRSYVRLGASPDRTASSLSAQLHSLRSSPQLWERLVDLVQSLVGARATDLTFAEGRFPDAPSPVDVMVALKEIGPAGEFLIPASTMSDGTLRYLAILATLLISQESDNHPQKGRVIVVEEIENGLFPDQASRILYLLREEAANQNITLITTTHSPALLDAVSPEDHEGIIVVRRDEDSRSRLTPLIEHENYIQLVQAGRLGQEVARGSLTVTPSSTSTSRSLRDIIS